MSDPSRCGHHPHCTCGTWGTPLGELPADLRVGDGRPLVGASRAAALVRGARAVLAANRADGYTVPARPLYPHQWSWDAAFVAIGLARDDQPGAEAELRSLFQGQWSSGLLPHIVFRGGSGDYFPGPEVWQAHRSGAAPERPETSGVVQPPPHATAAWWVADQGPDAERADRFLEELFPRLVAWHDYLYRERDPTGEGLVAIRHPWESGRDDSPLWDRPLQAVPLWEAPLPRPDRQAVPAPQRPSDDAYRRFLGLVGLFRAARYEEAALREAPFRVQDVLFNTLLVRAERDLAHIARRLGRDPATFEARAARTARAMEEQLWSPAWGMYLDYDLVAGEFLAVPVAAGFTPLFAGIPTRERAELMVRRLASTCSCPLERGCSLVPSYDRRAAGYSPEEYWRGPVWVNENWLLLEGARRYGFSGWADRVARGILLLVERCGFHEYFDPEGLRGLGAADFSWTAALILELLGEGCRRADDSPRHT